MTKEKFERKNIPFSRIEEIAENGNCLKASTISAVGMALKTFEELETQEKLMKKQQLKEKVLNLILSLEDSFTIESLFESLRKENIMDDKNKEQIIDIVDNFLESNLIEHIPFSDQYFVVKSI